MLTCSLWGCRYQSTVPALRHLSYPTRLINPHHQHGPSYESVDVGVGVGIDKRSVSVVLRGVSMIRLQTRVDR